MALVGRRVLFGAAAASQCGNLGCERRVWCCLPDLFEDRSVSRRRSRPGADRLGDRDGGGPVAQRDVSPLPGGRPGGRDHLAGLAPISLGRVGPCRLDIVAQRTIPTMRGFRRAKPVQHLPNALPHPLEEPLHQTG